MNPTFYKIILKSNIIRQKDIKETEICNQLRNRELKWLSNFKFLIKKSFTKIRIFSKIYI